MQSPLVSVILPTHNRATLLPRAIRSVLEQTHINLELIVVDDGSSDNSADVVREVMDKRVQLVALDTSVGAAAARNAGLEKAQAEWIAFQDDDDEWSSEKLAVQLDALQEHGDAAACVCSYELHKRGRAYRIEHRARCDDGRAVQSALLGGESYATPTLLVRRAALDAIGGFDPLLPRRQDFDLCLRLAGEGSFVFLPDVLMTFHHGEDSISARPELFVQGLEHIADKHEALFRANPGARSTQYFRAGKNLIDEGHLTAALPLLQRSLAANPMNWRAAACMIGVVTGAFAIARSMKS